MPGKSSSGLIDLLVEERLLSKKKAKQISKTAKKSGRLPLEVAVADGEVIADEIRGFVENIGIANVDVETVEIDWAAVEILGSEEAQRLAVIPIITPGPDKQVATADPLDLELADKLSDILQVPVVLAFAFPEDIRSILERGPEDAGAVVIQPTGDGFVDFIADETSYKAVEILSEFSRSPKEWRRPIVLIGTECNGKTHLLKAVHTELLNTLEGNDVVFASGDKLKTDPAGALATQVPAGFLLDDLDEIVGNAGAEEVFMQAFNAVFQSGGPIVISAGKSLSTMEGLSTRIKASLAICRTITLGKPRPETLEAIGKMRALCLEIDPDSIDWDSLISEAGGDLRRIVEALESGAPTVGPKPHRDSTQSRAREEANDSAPQPASGTAAMLREESEAIIEESRLAIEEIEFHMPEAGSEILAEAKEALDKATAAMDAGDYVASEQLGMEALEKAAMAHASAEEMAKDSPKPKKTKKRKAAKGKAEAEPDDGTVSAAIREADRAIREACDAGAEEYASKELRGAVDGLEGAKRLVEKGRQASRALEEAKLAAEKAADAARRARTRKEEARISQEKEKVRRCQLAIDEVKKEFDRLLMEEKDTPLAGQLEDAEIFIETAIQYQDVGSIGQALEQVMKARKRIGEISEEATLRRELRSIVTEVDSLVREAAKRTDVHKPQQLNDIQNALAEAERVLMGDSADYDLGLNWARVARQKALRIVDAHVETSGDQAAGPRRTSVGDQCFETFEVCESNQFVAAIARTAAETPHLVKSPLFIHGEVGVGKTHLLGAIYELSVSLHGDECILLTTAADFAEEYKEAVARGDTSVFRERYRNADLLIVDDFHHILDYTDGLREFFHTLSAVESRGGLVVVSASLPASKLGVADKSFASRLEGGVIAEIRNPSLEAREKVLRREAHRYDLSIPEEAIGLLASMITTNVRDLVGALGKVAARSRTSGGSVTGEIIREVLREVLPVKEEEDKWLRF